MFKAFIFSFILIGGLSQSIASTDNSDTLRLYYDIDISTLNDSQHKQLDMLLKNIKSREIISLKITAYADFLASTEYNKALSQRRADNVKQYLVAKAYSGYIKECIGKGELPPQLNHLQGVPGNRRVEIVMLFKPKTIEQPKPTQLVQAEEGEHIILKNLNFQPGRHYLTPASQPQMKVLLKTLIDNPTLHIEIQGHICCEYVEKDGFDQDTRTNNLSVNRARYIYNYLVRNGIAAERLQYKGFGSSKPLIYPEKTTDDQNKNRRVEIVIIKK